MANLQLRKDQRPKFDPEFDDITEDEEDIERVRLRANQKTIRRSEKLAGIFDQTVALMLPKIRIKSGSSNRRDKHYGNLIKSTKRN